MLFLAVFQIFEETSKFKRTNIGEWKVLNHLTQREKRICLLKSLDDHDEISEKDEKMIDLHEVLNQGLYVDLPKSIRHLKMEYHPFIQFYQ